MVLLFSGELDVEQFFMMGQTDLQLFNVNMF